MLTGIDSANEKLIRAAIHIKAVEGAIADYSGRKPHETIVDASGESVAHVIETPPIAISILIGEVVYQIRSALDHLAFDLVKRNLRNIPLPKNWVKCEFPLWLEIPDKWKGDTPVPQDFFERVLPGIPEKMYAFIERLQPYYHTAESFHLRALAHLSNIDKHRYMNLMRARLSHKQRFSRGSGHYTLIRDVDNGAPLPLADVDGLPTPVDMDSSVSAFVAFDEPELGAAANALRVESILQGCMHIAGGIVIPAFEEFLKKS